MAKSRSAAPAKSVQRVGKKPGESDRAPLKRRRQGQRVSIDDARPIMDAFLSSFRETANVMLACQNAGINRATAYRWLHDDRDGFTSRYREAEQDANDRIEAELHRRAIWGIEKPITVAGEREVIREYSDTLLIFLAKARMPAKYRERWEGDMPAPAWAQVQASAQATVFVIDGQQKELETMSLEDLERAKGALLAERAGQGGDVAAGGEVHNSVDEPAPE